ncbi:MAG: fibronectin type III domain-containing protein, partial [Candidatus Aenigmarchaeota archaeon]|nr:fibronectin type III domain-containing protein [Candidatus Aenigmarchaeota archaeon]
MMMVGSLSGKAKISLAGLLLTLSILSIYIYFVIAAPTTPSQVYLEGNTSANYDKEGTFSVNWTASTDAQGHVANYTVWLMFVSNGTIVAYLNDSNTGVSLTSLPQANYSFNVSALNDTGTWGSNATLVWVIVDTTNPSVNFTSANDTVLRTDSGLKLDINVSDTNNNTAWVWASGDAGATNRTLT